MVEVHKKMWHAIYEGDLTALKLILDGTAGPFNIDNYNRNGRTALMEAASDCEPEIVRILLDYGADPTLKSNDMMDTALHFACNSTASDNEIIELIDILMTSKLDIDAVNFIGMTPLSVSARMYSPTVMSCLLDHGADVNGSNSTTALHEAATSGSQCSLLTLLRRGGQVDLKSSDGTTPLMHACRASQTDLEIIRLLLRKGANPTIRTPTKKTALETIFTKIARLTPTWHSISIDITAAQILICHGATLLQLSKKCQNKIIPCVQFDSKFLEFLIKFGFDDFVTDYFSYHRHITNEDNSRIVDELSGKTLLNLARNSIRKHIISLSHKDSLPISIDKLHCLPKHCKKMLNFGFELPSEKFASMKRKQDEFFSRLRSFALKRKK